MAARRSLLLAAIGEGSLAGGGRGGTALSVPVRGGSREGEEPACDVSV